MKKKRLIPWLLCFLLVFATSSLVFLNQAQAAPTQTAGKSRKLHRLENDLRSKNITTVMAKH